MFSGFLFLIAAAQLSSDVEISPAVKAMATMYRNDLPRLERELKPLAEQGDRTAAALLGEVLMFPNRPGGPDFARSCDYSEAAGRHASALHNLATCYFGGTGRPKDLVKARQFYSQAADMRFAKAACALGNMLIHGDGGPPDVKRGLELCRRAADSGDENAQTDYGGYLLTNKYIAKDAVAARRYLSLAAEQGQPNAAFLLGQIYWNGDGVDKDVPKAAVWWITAYEKGRKDAAFLIGRAAFIQIVDAARTKQPVATPMIGQARKWLAIAAQEDPDAKKRDEARDLLRLLEQLLAGSEPVR